MKHKKIVILILVTLAIGAFFIFDLGRFLTLDYIKTQHAVLADLWQTRPVFLAICYLVIYVATTALSLPGAAVLTLLGGAVFGLLWGTVIVSFASSMGATLAFLVARYLIKDAVQNRFADKLKSINQGIEKDGAFYLFTLRLVPAFPFFVINLAMGITPIKTFTFYWVSQLGMFAGTVVYVNAGTQLGQLDSLSGILSPGILASFALLGIFPLLAKKFIDTIRANNVLKKWKKPTGYDTNMVVIGAGSGGLVTAYIAAAVKAKVTLIEKHKMGGDCLNTGCVPSKAIIRSAKFNSHLKRAQEFGFNDASGSFEFKNIMDRVHQVIAKIEPHDSVERYAGLGVDVIEGEAKITSPYTVEVNGKTITTKNIVIATGARPFVPPVKGIDQVNYLTSDNIWQLQVQPKRLVVLGGGPIGCELTQSFARLGSQVTQVEMLPRIMSREDEEVSALVTQKLESEGVSVLTNHRAKELIVEGDEKKLICERDGEILEVPFDEILVAVGRAANVSGFGLEALDVTLTDRKTIAVNEYMQTNYPNIYAVGDVAGPYQFTHTAAHQAWYAAVNALFGKIKKFRVDYRVIPWATFTEPEVARVGLNEQDANAQNIPYEVTTFGIDDLDRAIADSEAHGFIKVLTVPGKDKILGVTIVGEHAGDLIAEYVLAMKHGLGLNKILGTIHIYPTLAEANKYAAGQWKRDHAPQQLLAWVARFHDWVRG